jgi:uncharacterized membrane protein
MPMLILALAVFLGTHFALSHPLRAPLVKALGPGAFAGVYSLVALATFGWAILAFRAAPYTMPLWEAGDAMWAIASALMLIGTILFAGSLFGNPALPAPGAAKLATQPARGVFAITRHPMMWGFALWSACHILVAPNQAALWLAGSIAVLAIIGSMGQDAKKAKLMGDGWRDWSARTSFVPFGGQLAGRIGWAAAWPGRTVVLAGVALWLVASWLHPRFGLPLVGLWRWIGQ